MFQKSICSFCPGSSAVTPVSVVANFLRAAAFPSRSG
jgi:hypothetical protein